MLQELEKILQWQHRGNYIVVFVGVMDILTDAPNGKAEWPTDDPTATVQDLLAEHPEFELDSYYNRLGVTYCPVGFLQRKAA